MDKKIKLELIEKLENKELLSWPEVEKMIISGQATFNKKLSKKAIDSIKELTNKIDCLLSDNDKLNLSLIETSYLKGQRRFIETQKKTGKEFNFRYLAQRASIVDSVIKILEIKGYEFKELIENTNEINIFEKKDLL